MSLQDRIKAFQEKRVAEAERQRQKQLDNLAKKAEKVSKEVGDAEQLKSARAKVVVAEVRLAKAKEPVTIKVKARVKEAAKTPSAFKASLRKVGAFLDTMPAKKAAPKRKRAKPKIHTVKIGRTTLISRHPIKVVKSRKVTKKKTTKKRKR